MKLVKIKRGNRSLLNENVVFEMYGGGAFQVSDVNDNTFIFSQSKPFDLIELEQLLQSVGWGRRPLRRVRRALDHSFLKIGVWQHDSKFPRLIGFARCTGDGILDATIWDVAIHPVYQGSGLGKELMSYLIKKLKDTGVKRVTLFADSNVVEFYKRLGWILEPRGKKCAFWYSN